MDHFVVEFFIAIVSIIHFAGMLSFTSLYWRSSGGYFISWAGGFSVLLVATDGWVLDRGVVEVCLRLLTTFFLFFTKDVCTGARRRGHIAKAMASRKRPLPNISMRLGKTSSNAVASVSKGCSVRTPIGNALIFHFMKVGAIRRPIGGQGIVGIALSSRDGRLRRMVMMTCTATGGCDFAKTTSAVGTNRVRGLRASDMSHMLRNAMSNMRTDTTDNRPKASTRVHVHNVNSVGTSDTPLCIISNIPFSNDIGSVGPSSVSSVAILGSTTSTTLCNSHNTGNIVVVAAGRKRRSSGTAMGIGTSLKNSGHTIHSCSHIDASRCFRLC